MSIREEDEGPSMVDRRASSQPDRSEPESAVAPEQQTASGESLEVLLAKEREKAQSYLASWQRSAADFQNYKRRVDQEREEATRMAGAALIFNLLPLVDDLERALQNVDHHLAGLTWVDGIRLIYRKFEALLEMSGVEEIPAENESFDPNLHEAVMFGEGEDGKVTSVVQKGYKLGGRVLRPAMVVVGQSKKE